MWNQLNENLWDCYINGWHVTKRREPGNVFYYVATDGEYQRAEGANFESLEKILNRPKQTKLAL